SRMKSVNARCLRSRSQQALASLQGWPGAATEGAAMGLHDMGLNDLGLKAMASHAIQGVTDKIRRNAIGYAVCAICGLAVLVLATSAGVMALIPLVGAVYAQLIAAAVFIVIILGTLLWLQRTTAPATKPVHTPFNSAALGNTVPPSGGPDALQR